MVPVVAASLGILGVVVAGPVAGSSPDIPTALLCIVGGAILVLGGVIGIAVSVVALVLESRGR